MPVSDRRKRTPKEMVDIAETMPKKQHFWFGSKKSTSSHPFCCSSEDITDVSHPSTSSAVVSTQIKAEMDAACDMSTSQTLDTLENIDVSIPATTSSARESVQKMKVELDYHVSCENSDGTNCTSGANVNVPTTYATYTEFQDTKYQKTEISLPLDAIPGPSATTAGIITQNVKVETDSACDLFSSKAVETFESIDVNTPATATNETVCIQKVKVEQDFDYHVFCENTEAAICTPRTSFDAPSTCVTNTDLPDVKCPKTEISLPLNEIAYCLNCNSPGG
ncbi:uncharacterized protein LOC122817570 [Protopterus annectens]|uniref:uncharacterized protein LOC122817570 n=1 Tax=Protopterus annectens TaxID=7888 RepID=UPI001CFBC4EF|nr:uncharacterized protein LOC122817570 [Protopterus annectens]